MRFAARKLNGQIAQKHKVWCAALCATLALLGASTSGYALTTSSLSDEIVVVDCAGIPRVQEMSVNGGALQLTVQNQGITELTLEKISKSGEAPLKLSARATEGGVIFAPLQPGTWRLCNTAGSVDGVGKLALSPIPTSSVVTQVGVASVALAGATLVAVNANGSSKGSNQGNAATEGFSSDISAGQPKPGGGASTSPAESSFDPDDYSIGAPGEPLSPYR